MVLGLGVGATTMVPTGGFLNSWTRCEATSVSNISMSREEIPPQFELATNTRIINPQNESEYTSS